MGGHNRIEGENASEGYGRKPYPFFFGLRKVRIRYARGPSGAGSHPQPAPRRAAPRVAGVRGPQRVGGRSLPGLRICCQSPFMTGPRPTFQSSGRLRGGAGWRRFGCARAAGGRKGARGARQPRAAKDGGPKPDAAAKEGGKEGPPSRKGAAKRQRATRQQEGGHHEN